MTVQPIAWFGALFSTCNLAIFCFMGDPDACALFSSFWQCQRKCSTVPVWQKRGEVGGLKLFRQCPYGNNTFHKGASVKVILQGVNTMYIRSQTKLWMLVVAIYSKTRIIKIPLTGPGANSFPPYFRLVGNPDFYDHQLVCRNSHRFGIEKFIRKSSSIANLECSFFLDILLILVALRVGEIMDSALSALAAISAHGVYFNNFRQKLPYFDASR